MTKENNLMVYLKKQMEEYQQECESSKALYADLLEHIEECKDQIRQQQQMQDPGFRMLSPLADEETEDQAIARLKEQIAGYEKQKLKYLQEIRFYEDKITEMQEQLDKFEENEAENQKWKKKLEEDHAELVAAARAAEAEEEEADDALYPEEKADKTNTECTVKDEEDASKKAQQIINETACDQNESKNIDSEQKYNNLENVSRGGCIDSYAFILKKLTEIKGYAQLDPRRCKIELERLTEYVREQSEKLRDADDD